MTDRLGRADLHIHTRASDGISTVAEILERIRQLEDLDVVAITDHERIDAALAARDIARDLGLRTEIVVGEEVTTRGGHLLGLFLVEPLRPLRSLGDTIAAVHDQGGIAVPAHPLAPYPLCAQVRSLRGLLEHPDPRRRPDGLETFNPTLLGKLGHRRAVEFAREHGLAPLGNSDAHAADQIGAGYSTFRGRSAEELRAAIHAGETHAHGSFHGTTSQLSTFAGQLRKYGRDARDEVGGRVLRRGTGRDLGFPGGHLRPPRYDGLGQPPETPTAGPERRGGETG
jgi:predicted metal-dependent phosphoesterase TrpH